MANPDFGRAAAHFARHRPGYAQRLIETLAEDAIGMPGQRVLDVGTGTGLMARAMAGQGCEVTALDPSGEMIATAITEAEAAGLEIDHIVSRIEDSGLPDASFDVITAGSCWHWLDRPIAARECHRLLVGGGRLVIAHQDWQPRPGNVGDLTAEAIAKWNPSFDAYAFTFQYPVWLSDLTAAGFAQYEILGFPTVLRYTHLGWIGRVVASAHIGAALTPKEIVAFRQDFATMLAANFPDPFDVDHRVFALILTRE